MNISPRTGRPKIVAGDKMAATRFAQFCEMLVEYGPKFDVKQVGPRAVAAKHAVESLLEAIDLEMLPKGKRPEDHPLFANLDDDGKEVETHDSAEQKPAVNVATKARSKKAEKVGSATEHADASE